MSNDAENVNDNIVDRLTLEVKVLKMLYSSAMKKSTLRDKFAMTCPDPKLYFGSNIVRETLCLDKDEPITPTLVFMAEVKLRYQYADLMVAEREKK